MEARALRMSITPDNNVPCKFVTILLPPCNQIFKSDKLIKIYLYKYRGSYKYRVAAAIIEDLQENLQKHNSFIKSHQRKLNNPN